MLLNGPPIRSPCMATRGVLTSHLCHMSCADPHPLLKPLEPPTCGQFPCFYQLACDILCIPSKFFDLAILIHATLWHARLQPDTIHNLTQFKHSCSSKSVSISRMPEPKLLRLPGHSGVRPCVRWPHSPPPPLNFGIILQSHSCSAPTLTRPHYHHLQLVTQHTHPHFHHLWVLHAHAVHPSSLPPPLNLAVKLATWTFTWFFVSY